MRFCSRCGFPLAGVARLLESGGELEDEAKEPAGLTKRQKGMREACVALIAGILFAGIAFLLTAMKEDLFVLIPVAAVIFFGGLVRLIYVALLERDEPEDKADVEAARRRRTPPVALKGAKGRGKMLPTGESIPASVYLNTGSDTSEMAPPRSVTESTTRLLEDEQKS